MVIPRLGLSHRRRLPAFYVLNSTYRLDQALKLMFHTRKWKIIKDGEIVELEYDGTTRLCLLRESASLTLKEWHIWQKHYLPSFSLKNKSVLDVGAGCGETAFLYFLHGAKKVIAVEPNVKAVKCLKENAQRNKWDVEIIAEHFSLEHLKFDYDFMKMDGEGCEELLLQLPKINKPSIVEVHSNELLSEFERRGWMKIHSMTKNIHLVVNFNGYAHRRGIITLYLF